MTHFHSGKRGESEDGRDEASSACAYRRFEGGVGGVLHSCVERLKTYRSELESRIECLNASAVEDIERLESEEKDVDRMINTGQAHLASMVAMRALSLHVQ